MDTLPLIRTKKTNQDVFSKCLEKGFLPMQSLILANRVQRENWEDLLNLNPQQISSPKKYQDMEKSAKRIVKAIKDSEKIVCSVDFDSDGINSGAVFKRAMTEFFGCPQDNIHVQISHRSLWGYGLTSHAVKNIFREHANRLPGIILTADHGSSNEEQIQLALETAKTFEIPLDVIVTDHHHIPEKWPESAYSFVNPQRQENLSQDEKDVCGAMVMFLLMLAVKDELKAQGLLDEGVQLFQLLSHCALATISDVMSLESPANRYICKAGFNIINTSTHPAWSVLRSQSDTPIEEGFVGFQIAPRINASSRVGLSGKTALDFLTTKDIETAVTNYKEMTQANEERKEIGLDMESDAIDEAERQVDNNNVVIVIYLENGNAGNSGITAGKIKERFNRPCILLAPINQTEATGSARSIPGLDIRGILERVDNANPGILLAFGGHPVAAGLRAPIDCIEKLTTLLNEEARKLVSTEDLTPIIDVDFHLNDLKEPLSLIDINKLDELKPYGQKFPPPVFSIEGEVAELKPIGKLAKTHLSFQLKLDSGHSIRCIWFSARACENNPFPIEEGESHIFCAEASINRFMNNSSPQLMISTVGKIDR